MAAVGKFTVASTTVMPASVAGARYRPRSPDAGSPISRPAGVVIACSERSGWVWRTAHRYPRPPISAVPA